MKIGVFDSGFGGLTVLRELLRHIPGADYAYLGDTARLPYGAKSRATVARYATSSARFLVEEKEAEFLVIACNTASALALDAIREAVSVPVLGVVETGANAADASSMTRDVLVIATVATVQSHAYAEACAARKMRAIEKACPLLVPLVEEGWTQHPVTEEVVRIYMGELKEQAETAGMNADTLVLACTHYPLLRATIERAVPPGMQVIDSAEVTAQQVASRLGSPARPVRETEVEFFATDSVTKFRELGTRFLGQTIPAVRLVDLGG
ncbi:MAG: glutamate racemase [Acidobacteriaceae bacterium]